MTVYDEAVLRKSHDPQFLRRAWEVDSLDHKERAAILRNIACPRRIVAGVVDAYMQELAAGPVDGRGKPRPNPVLMIAVAERFENAPEIWEAFLTLPTDVHATGVLWGVLLRNERIPAQYLAVIAERIAADAAKHKKRQFDLEGLVRDVFMCDRLPPANLLNVIRVMPWKANANAQHIFKTALNRPFTLAEANALIDVFANEVAQDGRLVQHQQPRLWAVKQLAARTTTKLPPVWSNLFFDIIWPAYIADPQHDILAISAMDHLLGTANLSPDRIRTVWDATEPEAVTTVNDDPQSIPRLAGFSRLLRCTTTMPQCPEDVLRRAGRFPLGYVRKAAARNPNCPPDLQVEIALSTPARTHAATGATI